MSINHPTKATLIATVVAMLDEKALEEIRSEDVLEASGISKGSLYHHFEDFADLINAALVFRFSRGVDSNIKLISKTLAKARTEEELFQALSLVNKATQDPEVRSTRFERARVLAISESNPKMALELAQEQDRLTDAVTDLVQESINKGFINASLDPASVAVFIQAYTLGKVVDDIAGDKIEIEKYLRFLDNLMRKCFAANSN